MRGTCILKSSFTELHVSTRPSCRYHFLRYFSGSFMKNRTANLNTKIWPKLPEGDPRKRPLLSCQSRQPSRTLCPQITILPRFGGTSCTSPQWTKTKDSCKGGLSKGAQCAKQTFQQRNGLPSAVVTRHPVGLGKPVQSHPGLSSRKSHLQVQMPQGEWPWAGDRPVFWKKPL